VLDASLGLALAGELHDPASGRTMRVLTSEPGVQLYTGNYLDHVAGKSGRFIRRTRGCAWRRSISGCAESGGVSEHDAAAGETFRSTTVYEFSAR